MSTFVTYKEKGSRGSLEVVGMTYCVWKINIGRNVHEEQWMLSLSLRILSTICRILSHIYSWAIHSQYMSVCCVKLTNSVVAAYSKHMVIRQLLGLPH